MLAFALVAAACSDSADEADDPTTTAVPTTEAPTASTAAPTTAPPTTAAPLSHAHGGEAIVAADHEPPTLNSFAPGGDNKVVSVIGEAYFSGVYKIDGQNLEFVPELVTELPTVANGGVTVNPDGTMTVKYQIRDEAQWSDGEPVSGDDFQFTLETILDPDLPIFRAVYEDIVPGSWSAGPKTFEYTLSKPTLQFESLFTPIIPKHAVEGTDFVHDWNDKMWPSAGPFVFDEWKKGEFVKVVRNPNYWKTDAETAQQLPYLDSVTFRFIPETETVIDAFRAREVDIIQPPPLGEVIKILQTLEPEGVAVEVLAGPDWEHLAFQFGDNRFKHNPNSVNDNLNYRKAVAHAINKDLIVDEILTGQVEPLDSFVEVFAPTLSQGSWKQYDYNPETARTYVDAAKTELGVDTLHTVFTTTSNNDNRVKMSELFVEMFADIGIDYKNELVDSQIFFGEDLDFGNFDLGEWAWTSDPGFSSLVANFDLFDPELPPPAGQNVYRWGTAEVSGEEVAGFNQGASSTINADTARLAEIRDAMNSTVDQDELIALIAEAENIVADNVVVIPLFARTEVAAVWEDEIAGFKHNPSQSTYTWNMATWRRVDL